MPSTSIQKTVFTWGLLSGAVSSATMLAFLPFVDDIDFEKGAVIGYTSLVLSALLIYFGVRSYRDHVVGGPLTFGQAFKVGISIALVSALCYVLTWELVYFKLAPDFGDKFSAYSVERVVAQGATAEEIETAQRKAADFKRLYDQPLMNAAITFAEPFPFGLLAALVSAAILRHRPARPARPAKAAPPVRST
jgi:hypothetical protein